MISLLDSGKFIVIEGGDACGKKTQTERLHARLEEHVRDSSDYDGMPYHIRSPKEEHSRPPEPKPELTPAPMLLSFPRYDTPLGQVILRHLKGYIMLAEEHVRDSSDHTIDGTSYHVRSPEDALAFQCMMVADRYHVAEKIELQLAAGGYVVADRWWQSGLVYGSSDGLDSQWLLDVSASLPLADLNILIDVSVDVAMARRSIPRDRYEESKVKREDIRAKYLDLWRKCSDLPNPLSKKWVIVDGSKTPDEVELEIQNHVSALLAVGDEFGNGTLCPECGYGRGDSPSSCSNPGNFHE